MFQSPGAILFKLGPITVRWYGLMFVLAFLTASALAMRLGKRWNLDTEKILNTAFWAFGGGVLGARLYFVALNFDPAPRALEHRDRAGEIGGASSGDSHQQLARFVRTDHRGTRGKNALGQVKERQ